MVTITAPGVEIKEVDLSFYDFPQPKEETQNVFVTGFANKGYNCVPYEFTSKNSEDDLLNTFGTPTNEAERYFFNACAEAIKRDKVVLYASRMPYLNTATANYKYVDYSFKKAAVVMSALNFDIDLRPSKLSTYSLSNYADLLALQTINQADPTLSSTFMLELSTAVQGQCDQDTLEKYRTSVKKPSTNHFIIVDKNQEVYKKIPVDAKHAQISSRYMLGMLPIVTTATNAMYYQKLIATSLISTETTYNKNDNSLSDNLSVIDIYAVNGYRKLSTDLSGGVIPGEYMTEKDKTCFYDDCISVGSNLSCCITHSPTNKIFEISVYINAEISAQEVVKTNNNVSSVYISCVNSKDAVLSAVQYGKRIEDTLSCFEPTSSLSSETVEVDQSLMVYPSSSKSLAEGNKDAMTLSKFAMASFPTINFMPDSSFDRDRLKNIGVVVFQGWIDAEAGNKIKYEPVEAFAGSLKADDVDPTTGKSRFIDDIINTNSKTIEFYSNCFNSQILATTTLSAYDSANNPANKPNTGRDSIDVIFKNSKKGGNLSADIENSKLKAYKPISENKPTIGTIQYSDIGLLHINNCPSFVVGFKELDASEKTISYNLIMSSLDKMFEKSKDINKMQIDMVVDAGIANITQFMYTVNGNNDITTKNDKVWLSCYDPVAYRDDDFTTNTVDETRSAVELWDICERLGDGTASVEKNGATEKWQLVLKKYDDFCKKRSDCFFIADGLRPFCLCGNHKRVRANDFNTTVDKTLTPFIKWMSGKIDTSYGCGYCDWYQIVDPTSGVNMWMPPSVKAMCVNLDTTNKNFYWTVPAGINNGKLNPTDNPSKVIVKDIAFSPTTEEAGNIYTKSWNYCTYYYDEGLVLEGQRTFQSRPTAFDRINVRKLFLYLERKTFLAARYFIYQGNTAYTRQKLIDTITPYFEYAKTNGGLYDYRLQCDENNNTPDTIDRNELHVKVAIKPTKAIEFIEITFYALRTGGSFTEAGMQD